jgi:Right handed beta helix region
MFMAMRRASSAVNAGTRASKRAYGDAANMRGTGPIWSTAAFPKGSSMTKSAFLFALVVTALASIPAHAQRVFVASNGFDSNPCTVTQPCRSLQQAYNSVAANGEIDVLDPAGYGPPFTITHGISIQGHGWASITQAASTGAAITVSVATSDPVMLNGLILDGAGTGEYGINVTSGSSVQILNSVVRHFRNGIYVSTNGTNLLIEDTVASDNLAYGILSQGTSQVVRATLNRITTNNNEYGVLVSDTTIANSVMSNNGTGMNNSSGTVWLAKSVISGNNTGVFVGQPAATVNSYGDRAGPGNLDRTIGGVSA